MLGIANRMMIMMMVRVELEQALGNSQGCEATVMHTSSGNKLG